MATLILKHLLSLISLYLIVKHASCTYTGLDDEYSYEKDEAVDHYDPTAKAKQNCTSDTAIIDKLLNGTGYSKFKVPSTKGGVEVHVEFWIQEISSISEITNDFEMDIYINEMWHDEGLNFEHLSPCKHNLSLNGQVLDRLWSPQGVFINSKVAKIHESPFKNVFLMLYENGSVWTNIRVRVKGPCKMDLTAFPLDSQSCGLIYESFNYNNQEVRMRWSPLSKKPASPMNKILLPDYDLVDIETELVVEQYPAGLWDELHVRLFFKRRFVWYFMQAYTPTYLIIFISWISFALGPTAIPARTMLGVNSLLAIVFQFSSIMRNLPKVAYVKAIDVFLLSSMTFIFASLLELAIVGYKVKNLDILAKKRPILCRKRPNDGESSPKQTCTYEKRFMFPVEKLEIPWKKSSLSFLSWSPDDIDKVAIVSFPTFFAVFNVCYWSYYLS
uniref:Neur_chan_LBD domain-containing protein n=1 Tax=Rhabditophanes sp. KR3021 TaxID=114890 RepID=A0AC35UIQ5_9BILA